MNEGDVAKSILDVGCGTGEATSSLLDRFDNVNDITAIDVSPEFIDYANSNKDDERISFVKMNAESEWPLVWTGRFNVVSVFWLQKLDQVRIRNSGSSEI